MSGSFMDVMNPHAKKRLVTATNVTASLRSRLAGAAPVVTSALVEIRHGELVGGGPYIDADPPSRHVVDRRVNPAPDPRQRALFRRIAVRGPLQRHVDARAFFEHQVLVLPDLELTHPAWEELVTG